MPGSGEKMGGAERGDALNGPDDWVVQCRTCGLKRPAREAGVFRYAAYSKGKVTLLTCPRCGRWRCHSVKRRAVGTGG